MILVTGATGLVGGHLLWHLLQENQKVTAIKRASSNLNPLRTIFSFYTNEPDLYLDRIEWKIADVLDESSLCEAFQDVRIVYHCAAIVSLGNGSEAMIETNGRGTKNVVKSALQTGIDKLCFVSSIAACGHVAKGLLIDENVEWTDSEGAWSYSCSKFYFEADVWIVVYMGLKLVIGKPVV